MDTQAIQQAIETRAWYPLAGIVVALVLRVWTRLGPTLLVGRIPRRWQWVPPVVVPALAAFVESQSSGLSLVAAVAMSVYAGVSAGGAAIGLHHAAKRIGGN